MKHLSTLLRMLVPALALAALGVTWAATMSVLAGPALLDTAERWAGRVLPHEESLRVLLVAMLALIAIAWGLRVLSRATTTGLCAYGSFVLGAASTVFVCATDFDLDHWLGAEYSWIRYTTAFFLVAAAVFSALIAAGYARRREPRTHTVLFAALAVAFLTLASDELLTIHETFGDFIKARYHATPFATDMVTMAYGVVAIGFVALLLSRPTHAREYVERHTASVALFASAALVFIIGQLGDTFDVDLYDGLSKLALSRPPEHLFSDFWYPLWAPKRFMNDLEEVHECIAASLFMSAFLLFWIERTWPAVKDRVWFARPRQARALGFVLVIGVGLAVAWAASGRPMDSAVVGAPARAIAGPADGMVHSDVVISHPRWGLLVANEGGGNVIRWHDGRAQPVPDPRHQLTDIDCVAATDSALWVSSPSLGTVFSWTEAGGWVPRFGPADGLGEPEGLIVVDSTLYVVDETRHLVSVIDLPSRRVTVVSLDRTPWRWPEGINYHPGLDRVLITDDVEGDVIALDREGHVTPFARAAEGFQSPEDVCVTRDGRILVADSERREITELDRDGHVVQRIRFHRMYGYLVGVAVVEATTPGEPDRLYAVSSDGFTRMSFMPSYLWELDLPPPIRR